MLSWLFQSDDSLWRDLRAGRVGWLPRLGLSLASAAALLTLAFFVLGTVEATSGWVNEASIATALGLCGTAWCGLLGLIWWTYPRGQVLFRIALCVAAVWIPTIMLAALIDASVGGQAEMLIVACVFMGIASTLFAVTLVLYRHFRRAPAAMEPLQIRCPRCGYSMVGLSDCRCPECGANYTIDGLLREQGRVAQRPAPPHEVMKAEGVAGIES